MLTIRSACLDSRSKVILTILGAARAFRCEITPLAYRASWITACWKRQNRYARALFAENTQEQLQKTLEDVWSEPDGLILDLRNNGGDTWSPPSTCFDSSQWVIVYESTRCERKTLQAGEVVWQRTSDGVLINEGAVRLRRSLPGDPGRGAANCRMTLWKGSVQFPRAEEHEEPSITIARWLTPVSALFTHADNRIRVQFTEQILQKIATSTGKSRRSIKHKH